jgi:hypothetical protein
MAEDFTNARIRVKRESMPELLEALYDHEVKLLDGRDTVKGAGRDAMMRFNDRLKATRKVITEAERTRTEMAWDDRPWHEEEPRDGQLERPVEA